MSHIDVHDVSQRARARLGRSYQIAALLPPAPRPRFDQWQSARNVWALNRDPFQHALPPYPSRAPTELELPRDEIERAARAAAPAAEPRARAPARAALAVPETLSFAWYCAPGALGATGYATSPALPWPCRVVGFSIDIVTAPAIGGTSAYNLFAVDAEYNGVFAGSIGSRLIPFIGDTTQSIANLQFGPVIRVQSLNTTNEAVLAPNVATMAIGAAILEPGKRIAIGVRNVLTEVQDFGGHITLERLGDVELIIPRVTAPRPAPRPADPRTAPTPRAAPARLAPPPPPEPKPVAIRGERATQQQRQIYWIGTQPRIYITEAGKIPVDAPLGDPSLLQAGGQLQTAPRFAQPEPPVPGFLPETGAARERP